MKLAVVLLAALCVLESSAQQRIIPQRRSKKDSVLERGIVLPSAQQVDVRRLFGQIEHGVLNSSLGSSPIAFGDQVFINISGAESGYFSANQAASILQTYFAVRNPTSFHFTRYNDRGPNPYATGRLSFTSKGQRESAQIYVSLTYQESRWVISQFNIY